MIKLVVSMSTRAGLLSILIRSHHVLFDGECKIFCLNAFMR